MHAPPPPQRQLVLSYLALRKAVGIIGVALPFALAIGKRVSQGAGLEESVSYYYYTDMRNVFVGSLCAIGIFLMSTRGYDWRDEVAGWFACVFAIGVAFCPTTPLTNATPLDKCVGAVHLTCAALLFLTLAIFSWFLFTETDPIKTPTPRKLKRNMVYRVCAVAIVACIVLIAVVKEIAPQILAWWPHAVFCLESTAIIAFGFSWLVKGEMILKDLPPVRAASSATASSAS